MRLIEGIPVVPRSRIALESIAISYLQKYQPEALLNPIAIDITQLLDCSIYISHGYGLNIVQSFDEPNIEAQTDFSSKRIEVTESCYNLLEAPCRARFTVGHELGHVILHSGQSSSIITALQRTTRKEMKTYEDPEWQADHFSGALLMPVPTAFPFYTTLRKRGCTFKEIAEEFSERFKVSYNAATTRIKKISQSDNLARLALKLDKQGVPL